MVVPPAGASTASDNVRYLRLSNALHYAAAMADRLGTDVAVLDESETVYFIEDQDLAPLQPAS